MKDYIINWVKHLKCSLCSRQVLNKVLSIIKMRTKDIHNKSSLSSLHMITCNVGRRNEMHRSHMNIRRSPQWKEIINIIHITDKLELSAYMMYKKVKYNNCWCPGWDVQLVVVRLPVPGNNHWHCDEIEHTKMQWLRFHTSYQCATLLLGYKDTNTY